MKVRKSAALQISAIGIGCLGFSHGYRPGPTNTKPSQIRPAHEIWDARIFHGNHLAATVMKRS